MGAHVRGDCLHEMTTGAHWQHTTQCAVHARYDELDPGMTCVCMRKMLAKRVCGWQEDEWVTTAQCKCA